VRGAASYRVVEAIADDGAHVRYTAEDIDDEFKLEIVEPTR